MKESDLIGTGEASRILGVSTQSVREFIAMGILSAEPSSIGNILSRVEVEELKARRDAKQHSSLVIA